MYNNINMLTRLKNTNQGGMHDQHNKNTKTGSTNTV